MKYLIIGLMIGFFVGCVTMALVFKDYQHSSTKVYQTIKRTCNLPDCYYALYTTVYYHDAMVKEWIDDAAYLTPQDVINRKTDGDRLIKLYDTLELKYEKLLK